MPLPPSQFQLVITDLNMPGMSGIACPRLHRVCIEQSEGHFDVAGPIDTQRFATEAGFSAFLSKPFPATALWRTLESVLGNFPPADGKRAAQFGTSDVNKNAQKHLKTQGFSTFRQKFSKNSWTNSAMIYFLRHVLCEIKMHKEVELDLAV